MLIFSLGAAQAQPDLQEVLIPGSAQEEVAITATFSGSELFVFGAVARSRFLEETDGRPEIAIVVRGPSSPVMVRKKSRVAGVWMNADAVRIAAAPSFYAVASTKPLPEILDPTQDRIHEISLDRAVLILGVPNSADDPEAFRQAAIRLRRNAGLYREEPDGVSLRQGTLYQTRMTLPANIVEGDYEIRVYLLRAGKVMDQATISIPVRKQGIERVLFVAAQETPFLYGLGSLLTALFAAWAASEMFRRFGRG